MTEIQYFPAVMVGHFNKITSNLDKGEYRFWGKDTLFKYDKLLYSSHYIKERYKKLSGGESYFDSIGYDGLRMLDSGGFQVRSLGIELNPQDVIDVYKRERADVGFILDEPLNKEFSKELIESNHNKVKEMVKLKHLIPDTCLLNICHGVGIERKKIHYETIKEFNNDLDGWSVSGTQAIPPIFHAWSFMYLLEHDKTLKDKRFHFLGLTGNKALPVIYYLGKLNLVKYISFDSTKYGREGIMADMRNPAFLGERLSIGNMAKGNLVSNKWCPCPICQNISMERMQKDSNFVILHNLYWEIQKMNFFDSFETSEGLKRYVMEMPIFDEKTRVAIKFIDCCLKEGIAKAEKRFKVYFKLNKREKSMGLTGWT